MPHVQMDALALFHDAAAGANADASGMVTLIAAARILSRADNRVQLDALKRPILFMLFNGVRGSATCAVSMGCSATCSVSMSAALRVQLAMRLRNPLCLGPYSCVPCLA